MCFCVLLYFTACMLYYCNTVGWAWWDWGLIWLLTILLQCFDTVGWVTWPVKISSPNDLYCVEWDVKPYSTTTWLSTLIWCLLCPVFLLFLCSAKLMLISAALRGALQHPGPQFLGTTIWWEWKAFNSSDWFTLQFRTAVGLGSITAWRSQKAVRQL